MPQIPPITKWFMMICSIIFLAGAVLGLDRYYDLLALWPIGSGAFWPWQVVTYAFLHGDFNHLFFNMLGLWMFGSELERLWGDRRYVQFLLAGAIAAAVTQLVVTGLVGSMVPTVGASGALYALLLAYGMLFPHRQVMLLIPPIPMKARTLVIVFGAIELVLGVLGRSGVAHFAHLGGIVGGWLMIHYWRGSGPFSGRGPRRR